MDFDLDRRRRPQVRRLHFAHVGEYLAVVLDNKVQEYAATSRSQIHDTGTIEGRFTRAGSARICLMILRSGALPAGIKYLEERTVVRRWALTRSARESRPQWSAWWRC